VCGHRYREGHIQYTTSPCAVQFLRPYRHQNWGTAVNALQNQGRSVETTEHVSRHSLRKQSLRMQRLLVIRSQITHTHFVGSLPKVLILFTLIEKSPLPSLISRLYQRLCMKQLHGLTHIHPDPHDTQAPGDFSRSEYLKSSHSQHIIQLALTLLPSSK